MSGGAGGKLQNGAAPSPPGSPTARFRHSRGKAAAAAAPQGLHRLAERLVYLVATAALRRRGVLLVVPLLYVSLMLLFLGRWNLDAVPVGVTIPRRTPPGAVYRSPQVFRNLWPFMQADTNHSNALMTAWHQKASQRWKPCINRRLSQAELPPSNGFLIIEANGGLNQQRLAICDAVAVAGLLNATLVIPTFHLNSVWRDSSKFGDIFDEEYFIDALKNQVRVAKELPKDVLNRFDNNISNIKNMRSKALSSKTYYIRKVLPKLLEDGAVRIAPFSSRLAHTVPSNIQDLRCLSNYVALRFSQPIRTLSEEMVSRMVKNSLMSGGKYVSVHLRFEEDMVAFSCCTYDGGNEEKREMDNARERGWRGKFHKHGRKISPEVNRMEGRCPLTPLEVGMMLRGMGFDNTTSIYVASGKIYNEEKHMAPLRQLFPLLETKNTLASADELAPFKGYSSQLAALDYTVCAHSEVFVTTQGGNFPHFLMGHRRFLYGGHSKTIKPDKKRLVLSFDNPNIRCVLDHSVVVLEPPVTNKNPLANCNVDLRRWERFKRTMQDMLHHSDMKGITVRKSDASLFTFPMPDCMCQQAET